MKKLMIVFGGLVVVAGGYFTYSTYIQNSLPTSTQTTISDTEFAGTYWVPYNGEDAVLWFKDVKASGEGAEFYEYQIASDSQVREAGYWKVENGAIVLTPTETVTLPAEVEKIIKSREGLLVYFEGQTKPSLFVEWHPN